MTEIDGKNRAKERTLEDWMNLPYTLQVNQTENGDFFVRYLELPGCMTQVASLEDVALAAREILEGWLEVALEFGDPIPEPKTEFSGKFQVRISQSLHRELSTLAGREGISLNALVGEILSSGRTNREVAQQLDDMHNMLTRLNRAIPHFEGIPSPSSLTGLELPSEDKPLAYAA